MTEPKAAIALVATVALALQLPTSAAHAQLVSKLEAGALVSGRDGSATENALSLRPAVEYENPFVKLSAAGSAWRTNEQWQLGEGHASGAIISPTIHGLRAELSGAIGRIAYDPTLASDQAEGRARVEMLFAQRGGFWLGGGIDRPMRVAVVSAVEVTGGGAWTRLGNAMLTGSVTNFSYSKIATTRDSSGSSSCIASQESVPALPANGGADVVPGNVARIANGNGECRRQSRFSDLEGSVEWAVGPIELAAHGGYRLGAAYDVTQDSRRWGGATATYWLTSQFAAIVGGGRQPANPARGLPPRSYANLGVMLAYWPLPKRTVPVASHALVTAFQVVDAGYSHHTVILRVAGVERVEVMGDFTEWEPRELTRIGRDRWEITLPVAPGIHQINIRLDNGKWRPPPGLPTMRDGFNGDVGILVVQEK